MNQVFTQQHLLHDSNSTNQTEAFAFIAAHAKQLGIIDNEAQFSSGLSEREAHDSTGFMGGIAIPHCKSDTVQRPAVFVVQFSHPIAWETMDDTPVKTAVSLAIPAQGSEEGLRMLTTLSRAMVKPDLRRALQSTDTDTVVASLLSIIEP